MLSNTFKTFGLGAVMGTSFLAGVAFTNDIGHAPATIKQDDKLQYKWYPPELPAKMSFAGENVPLDRWEVSESLDREMIINTCNHAHILIVLKLAGRIFPVLEKQLKENGLPDDFKYVCVAESSLSNPTSRKRAVGYWQFLQSTATRYGLEVNDEVDERYDLIKSTNAACRYLKQAYDKLGSWTAAAASYNCGISGYKNKSVFQRSANYYDLILPEETNRYIFRVLALKEIMEHPEQYGFYVPSAYKPVETKTVEIVQSIPNLAEFAVSRGTSYKMLCILNPWLRGRSLTIRPGKHYEIRLPVESGK